MIRKLGRSIVVPLMIASALSGSHASASSVLASGGDVGNGWVVFKFRTDGAAVSARLETETSNYGTHSMLLLYDAGRTLVRGFGFGQGPVSEGVMLDVNLLGENVHHETLYRENGWCAHSCGAGVGIVDFTVPGTYWLVMYITGNQLDHQYEFTAEPGAELLAVEHGTEAYLVYVNEFRGIATAHASPVIGNPYPIVGPTAEVIVEGVSELHVGSQLIGTFFGGFSPVRAVEIDGPEWSNRGCYRQLSDVNSAVDVFWYCWFTDLDGPNKAGPGDWRFRIRAEANADLTDTIGIWAADVRIPA